MTKYNSHGEGFASTTGKGAPMGGDLEEANEIKQAKANKSTKAKIKGAPAQVAKTKRSVSKKKTNAGMSGKTRTVLSSDLKNAL